MTITTFWVALNCLGMVVLFAEVLFAALQRPSRGQASIFIATISTLLIFVGYHFEITGSSLEGAIDGVKVAWFGKLFASLATFMFVAIYCRINIPKAVISLLVAVHVFLAILVFTCDKHQLFFIETSFTTSGAVPHIEQINGPLYYFAIALTCAYFLANSVFAVRSIIHAKTEQDKFRGANIFALFFCSIAGLFVYLTGVTDGYDTTVLGLLASSIILMVLYTHFRVFDLMILAKDQAIDDYHEGFLIVNPQQKITYANDFIHKIFPDFQEHDEAKLLQRLLTLAQNGGLLFMDDKVYQIVVKDVVKTGVYYGQTIAVMDITNGYKYTDRLEKEIEERTRDIVNLQRSVISCFANVVEARDGTTGEHIKNTSNYVELVARGLQELGLYKDVVTDDFVSIVTDVAPLHDLGKICIPDSILLKPGKLTKEEFDVIKTHPAVGAKLIEENLSGIENETYLRIAKEVALCHHERWDGTGYPQGLKGSEIPLSARIMAIADVYDALRAKRSYKEPFTKETSRKIILDGVGSHFDPQVAEAFFYKLDEIDPD